ncbi:vWA domain-containing protein [Streptomyces mexicanus]|uniref:VWA domain-containing protein n=1 Tax=Streptomyces mexicanus TaxID=178566 RepID=A0A7X1LPG5_9ACTN|nr:VWA domain-containing protein [Streptomyces mexicanus]MBC2864472.1 VWA domain-containing protein [Streptomyces mexicanus]
MRIDVRSQFDLIAQGVDELVPVLVDITAPHLDEASADTRPPHTLQVVLDRSGSMGRGPLEVAKTALKDLVDRLRPDDNFGLVAFDDQVQVVVPAGPLTDKDSVKAAITGLRPGGTTNLSAGYLRGLQEAERVAKEAGATVLLVSDGHANCGVTDPEILGEKADQAFHRGITTSALGIGEGYDEHLLAALACGGRGNDGMAEHTDAAAQFIAAQVDGLLSQAAQAVSLLLRMESIVRGVELVNELPVTVTPDGVLIELGSLYSGETRTLTLVLDVPAGPPPGPVRLGELELSWAELPTLKQHTATVSLDAEVAPPSVAATRTADPRVATELVFQRAQQAKRRAAVALRNRNPQEALEELRRARDAVQAATASAPVEMATDLDEELAILGALIRQTKSGNYSRSAKAALKRVGDASRSRGRQFAAGTGLDHHDWTDQPGASRPTPARHSKTPRRAWIDLAEAVRTLPLTPQDREPIAEAIAALLDGRPDFNASRFRRHALSTKSRGCGTDHTPDSLF